MAKTPKVKKKSISIHSRAARRAGSPSVNIGNVPSNNNTKSTQTSTTYTPHHHHASSGGPQGIRKRKTALTRNQKLRRKKGVERADAVSAKVEIKKEKSMDKLKKVKARAKDWDDVNSKGKKKTATSNAFGVLGGMDLDGENDGMPTGEQVLPIRPEDKIATTDLVVDNSNQHVADDDI